MSGIAESVVTVASWSVDSALGDPARSLAYEHGISRLGADVIVLPDVLDAGADLVNPEFADSLGYELNLAAYDDTEPQPGARQIGMLARRGRGIAVAPVRLGNRTALRAEVLLPTQSEPVAVYGVGFDSRSAELRRAMGESLLSRIMTEPTMPTIVAGDFQNLHPDPFKSWALRGRGAAALNHVLPRADARTAGKQLRMWSQAEAIETLDPARLRDADMFHRATVYAGHLPLAQIDHILYSLRRLDSRGFSRLDIVAGARRAIVASLQLRSQLLAKQVIL